MRAHVNNILTIQKWGLRLYFIQAFQPDELYQFLDITISLQISSQEAITWANIVFQSMSGFLDDIARIHGTHSFIHSSVHSFIHRSFVRSLFFRLFVHFYPEM